ncbi:MAG: hypothetical protein IKB79_01545 [Oscillospiraceae bacterium]|nr:hypothetical protein [Oscillospiraceae bacterium]
MKKSTSKLLALLLSVVTILAMLPAASANGDALRKAVVKQTQDIMDVDYTLQARIKRTDVTGDKFTAYTEAGVRPATLFEWARARTPLKGMPPSSAAATLEQFKSQLSMEGSKTNDIPHMPKTNKYGFSLHSFLTDVISRVSPSAPTSFKDALTHDALVALLPGADLNAADSKAAISDTAAAKAAYGKLAAGDILLAWDNDADVGTASADDSAVQAPMHAMVVKEVSGDQVTVMYPAFSQPLWYFQCSKCEVIDIDGPTSAAPKYTKANSYYTYQGVKTHKETHPDQSCTGSWKAMYGTTWRTETVSYDALLGEGDTKVPYGCNAAYLPYTLAVYGNGAPAVDVKVSTSVDANNIVSGFSAKVTSNYRIVAFDAVLTSETGTVQHFESLVTDWKAWSWDYSNPDLDLALMECKTGAYNLTLKVKAGNDYVDAYSFDFGLADAGMRISTDKTVVTQGADVTATLTTLQAGYTGIKATVSYDSKRFSFDAKKTTGSNVTFADDGKGIVTVRYDGAALTANATVAKLCFTAVSGGGYPVTEGVTPIKIMSLSTSKTPGATDAQLVGDRAEGSGLVTLGFTAVVHKNYAAGKDLIVVFLKDDSLVKKTQAALLYDGKPMFEITTSNYNIKGDRFFCIFGYITENADPALVTKDTSSGATMCTEIEYTNNVNVIGSIVDINDAQTIANIYNGKLPLEGNETLWFRADINRDGKVDIKDRNELMSSLNK